ncbi:hypothetical protein ACOMHN_007009 [Nucella lapillus]
MRKAAPVPPIVGAVEVFRMMRPVLMDPYDYAYGDPYYRDLYADPASYRTPLDYVDPADYWDLQEYAEPPSHRSHGRQPAHFRERAGPQAAVDPSSKSARPIGSRTNDDDFSAKDSRLFVGNLNTITLMKEDVNGIFGRLGNVTGISMHKGYAFVQFSNPGEARRALVLENGQVYAGQALDLNIVSQPKIKGAQKRGPEPPALVTNHQRPPYEEPSAAFPPTKRPRTDVGNPSLQRGNLVTLASPTSDHQTAQLGPSGGGTIHEPRELGCAQCDSVFNSAWSLILHFQQHHKVDIFRAKTKDGR